MRRLLFIALSMAIWTALSIAASAEENSAPISFVSSASTLSGYVDSSGSWQNQPTSNTPRNAHRAWWYRFLQRLRRQS
jgi:hypothetical protein